MTNLIEDPWRELPVPATDGEISGRRVDSAGQFDFFWARDALGHPLLVLNHSGFAISGPLPDLHGLEVFRAPGKPGSKPMLVWRLSRHEHSEIFHELCLDVIRAAEGCTTERAAVETSIGRTWRWHHLLRGGGRGGLTLAQQLGLFAELLVLRVVLLQTLPPLVAVRAWKGPLGEAKDFLWTGTAIEVKAKTRRSGPTVQINSEFQLDLDQHRTLWLLVAALAEVEAEASTGPDAFTLDALVQESMTGMSGHPEAHTLLLSRLAAAGYDASHRYADHVWRLVSLDCYRVDDDFPRIVPQSLPDGIASVQYSLSLDRCAKHLRDLAALQSSLRRTGDE